MTQIWTEYLDEAPLVGTLRRLPIPPDPSSIVEFWIDTVRRTASVENGSIGYELTGIPRSRMRTKLWPSGEVPQTVDDELGRWAVAWQRETGITELIDGVTRFEFETKEEYVGTLPRPVASAA